eukprot:764889-Hanusia_phi.AAC.10
MTVDDFPTAIISRRTRKLMITTNTVRLMTVDDFPTAIISRRTRKLMIITNTVRLMTVDISTLAAMISDMMLNRILWIVPKTFCIIDRGRLLLTSGQSPNCKDDSQWADFHGLGCDAYNHHRLWCTFSILYPDHTGVDASTACCACGGGSSAQVENEGAMCSQRSLAVIEAI